MTSEEVSTDSNAVNISELLSTYIWHVIIPRDFRKTILIELSSTVPFSEISSIMNDSLKSTYDDYYIEMLKITQIEPVSGDKTKYEIICLIIPNELFDKLRNICLNKCILYVGLSEDSLEYSVLNEVPELHRVAYTNREGEPSPYISNLITIS